MAGDHGSVGDDAARAKDLAQRASRAEDELDLALVEPDHLQRPRQIDDRWFGQAGSVLRLDRSGRGGGSLPHQAIARWLADRRLGLGGAAHAPPTLVDGAPCDSSTTAP